MTATPEQVEHDLELFTTTLDRICATTNGVDSLWHSAGIQLGLETIAQNILEQAPVIGLTKGPTAMEVFIRRNLEIIFQIGHEIGEGSEHILKCQCDKIPGQN